MITGSYLSIVTLNVNVLNIPTKRQRWADGYKNKSPIYGLQETHLKSGDTHRLKVKGWKDFSCKQGQKKAGVAILIPDKIDFVIKAVIRDKEGHFIIIKGLIQGEDIAIINIYAPNIGAPQYVRQMLRNMKREIISYIIIPGKFNTSVTPMDTSTKQKISKKTQAVNDTTDQLYLIDIYRAFHHKTVEFTFFSNEHGAFSRKEHILSYKSSLGNFFFF